MITNHFTGRATQGNQAFMLALLIHGMDDLHRLQTAAVLIDKSTCVIEFVCRLNHALKPCRDILIGGEAEWKETAQA